MKRILTALFVIAVFMFTISPVMACGSDCKCGCQQGKKCTCIKDKQGSCIEEGKTEESEIKCACKTKKCECKNCDCCKNKCKCNKKILGIFKRKCKCGCNCAESKEE